MEELAKWFETQPMSLQTYESFRQKVLALGSKHHEAFALYYLLAMLAGRLVAIHAGSPLTLDVSEEGHKRLMALAERAKNFSSLTADARFSLLNEIAATAFRAG